MVLSFLSKISDGLNDTHSDREIIRVVVAVVNDSNEKVIAIRQKYNALLTK